MVTYDSENSKEMNGKWEKDHELLSHLSHPSCPVHHRSPLTLSHFLSISSSHSSPAGPCPSHSKDCRQLSLDSCPHSLQGSRSVPHTYRQTHVYKGLCPSSSLWHPRPSTPPCFPSSPTRTHANSQCCLRACAQALTSVWNAFLPLGHLNILLRKEEVWEHGE